jgi:hypothetical protein
MLDMLISEGLSGSMATSSSGITDVVGVPGGLEKLGSSVMVVLSLKLTDNDLRLGRSDGRLGTISSRSASVW